MLPIFQSPPPPEYFTNHVFRVHQVSLITYSTVHRLIIIFQCNLQQKHRQNCIVYVKSVIPFFKTAFIFHIKALLCLLSVFSRIIETCLSGDVVSDSPLVVSNNQGNLCYFVSHPFIFVMSWGTVSQNINLNFLLTKK